MFVRRNVIVAVMVLLKLSIANLCTLSESKPHVRTKGCLHANSMRLPVKAIILFVKTLMANESPAVS